MPCYEPHHDEDAAIERQRLDDLTAVMCELCASLRARNIEMTTDAWVWWQLHQKDDRDRAHKKFQVHKSLSNPRQDFSISDSSEPLDEPVFIELTLKASVPGWNKRRYTGYVEIETIAEIEQAFAQGRLEEAIHEEGSVSPSPCL